MAHEIEELKTIVIKKTSEMSYEAYLRTDTEKKDIAIGRSSAEALGKYIQTYHDKFKLIGIFETS